MEPGLEVVILDPVRAVQTTLVMATCLKQLVTTADRQQAMTGLTCVGNIKGDLRE